MKQVAALYTHTIGTCTQVGPLRLPFKRRPFVSRPHRLKVRWRGSIFTCVYNQVKEREKKRNDQERGEEKLNKFLSTGAIDSWEKKKKKKLIVIKVTEFFLFKPYGMRI